MRLALGLALAAAAAAGLAAACMSGGERALPADRSAALHYVALGDSTVEGVGASTAAASYVSRLYRRLHAVYPNAALTNLGVGGATSADVVDGQLARAVALRPALVTVSIGPNDITDGVSVDAYERNLDVMFQRLARDTRALVVANLLPDLAVTPRFRRDPARDAVGRQTVVFNEALQRKAGRYGVVIVDLYRPSREEVPRRPELIAADGYHPSDEGYARWTELVWTVLEPRIALR